MANDPPIILADEPTGNLDSKTGKLIVEILHSLAAEDKKTVIIAMHDADIGSKADVVLQMEDGRLVMDSWHIASIVGYTTETTTIVES